MRRLFKPFSNERGVAMVLEVLLVVIVLAVAGFTIYTIHNHKASTTTANSNTPAAKVADSSCLSTYHDTDLCKFAANSTSFEKQAYKATLSITQSGQASTMTLENDGKGNTSSSITSNGQTINSIELAGDTYIESGSTWIKYPSGSDSTTTNPTSSMDIGVGATGISYKKIGNAACGSLTCLEYQVSDSAAAGSTQYAWFDTKSYLLREWKETDSSGNTTDMTISYAPVTISTPSPVTDFSTAPGQ